MAADPSRKLYTVRLIEDEMRKTYAKGRGVLREGVLAWQRAKPAMHLSEPEFKPRGRA